MFVHDRVFDEGLSVLTGTKKLTLCTQLPSTYTEADSTFKLGEGSTVVGSPQPGDLSGRKVSVGGVDDGAVVAPGGDVTHWALLNTTTLELLVSSALSQPVTLSEGVQWTSASFDLTNKLNTGT